ncbi:hypothetical protein V6N12_062610 [Hibiscus sabdariffa]|uniref:Uncharacterized protein n=1 Tax=Hibiscus sabdariffa TaxID=183260 RepID=A0ABR2F9F2_9ROSI
MTRNNLQGPILPLVSDIDRLFHQRMRENRATTAMYHGNEQVDDQQDQNAPAIPAAVRPRTIRDHLTPLLDDLNPGIVALEIQVAHFEFKSIMFNMLNSIRQFGGSPHEDARNDIASFRQADDESMYECWDCYKGLLRKCTNHGFQDWTRLGSGRQTSGKLELDANDSISAQLSAITNILNNLQKPSDVREAKALSCDHCDGNHHATDYPVMNEQASYGNQSGANASSSSRQPNLTAPPGFQANMPWHSETKGNVTASNNNSLEVTMQEFILTAKTMLQEHSASLSIREICYKLKEHYSKVTINKEDKFGGKSVEDLTSSHLQKEPKFLDDSSIEEDKGEKVDNERSEEQHANAAASVTSQPARDEVHPPPPFPQQLKKHKEDLQFQKFVSMLDQFYIKIPFLEAIDQVPSYAKFLKDIVTKKREVESYETVVVASGYCAGRIDLPMKKKDTGCFIIPCSIGDNFMGNTLCDLGSSVNLMPKVEFKKIGIGIERPTIVILQLADRSHVRPKGKVEDVIVKVGKFVFSVDFLILDCEVDDKAPIILGHPFLATGRILIDCEKGDFTMRVADQTVTINVFNTLRYMDDQEEFQYLHEDNTAVAEDSDIICCRKFIQIKNFEKLKKEDVEELGETPCETHQVSSFTIHPGMRFEALDFSEFTSPKPSLEHAPSFELKALPPYLKYVYLGSNETLPIIISSKLLPDQECSLINLLSQYKKAIG